MGSTRKHPHAEQPTEPHLQQLVEDRPETVREVYLAVHRLVVEALPDVTYSVDCTNGQIGYGAHQYGHDGWGMAALAPHSRWVSLVFMRATSLRDTFGILEGTGKSVRHVKIHSLAQFAERRDAIVALLAEARGRHPG